MKLINTTARELGYSSFSASVTIFEILRSGGAGEKIFWTY